MTYQDATDRLISDVVTKLRRVTPPIESLFLDVGERLTSAMDLLGGTAATFKTLTDRLGSDDLRNAINGLERAAAGISAISRGNAGNLTELGRLAALSEELATRLGRLCKTIGEVKLLAINAKIEAAHISASDLDFSVFTREIGRLATLAEEGLARLGNELQALGTLVDDTRDGQTHFELTHRESLTEITSRINASLTSAEAHRGKAAQAIITVATEIHRVSDRLGAVVVALQIGDITRQRVEHVHHALDVLEGILSDTGGLLTPPPSEDERKMMMAVACRLQAAQLNHTAQELDQHSCQAMDNLRALVDEARQIALIGTHAFTSESQGQGSFLLDLSRQMQAADTLMRSYSNAKADMEALVHSVSARVAEMVGHVESVHSIEVDMRIMGLNATLKCSRLGEDGRALSVIAQTLRSYAGSTVADAAALMTGLHNIIATSAALGGGAETGNETQDLSTLLEAMEGSAETLDTAGAELAAALSRLTKNSESVSATLESSMTRMGDFTTIAGALRLSAAHLNEAAGDMDLTSTEAQQVQMRLLALFDSRYTMSSERDIHMLFSGEAPATPAPSASGGDAVDDLLF